MSVPRCFGNAVEYDEHHGVCGGCAHRLNCANEIQTAQAAPQMHAPRPSYTSAAAPPPPARPQYSAPQYSTTPTQYHAAQYPPPGVYNFDEPVAEQFGAYVGFSFLDSLCVELRHLVGASRTHYMTKRRKP